MKISKKQLIKLINEVVTGLPSSVVGQVVTVAEYDAVRKAVFQILENKKITYVTDDPMRSRSNLLKYKDAVYIASVPMQQLRDRLYLRPAVMTIFSDIVEKFANFLNRKFLRAKSKIFGNQSRGQQGEPADIKLLLEIISPEDAGDFGMLDEENIIRIVAMPHIYFDDEGIHDNYYNATQEEDVYMVQPEGLA